MNLLAFDSFFSVSRPNKNSFQSVLHVYEYGNFAAMIKDFNLFLLCCNPTVDGQLFLHEFYKMYTVNHPLYPYIVDVCL